MIFVLLFIIVLIAMQCRAQAMLLRLNVFHIDLYKETVKGLNLFND